MNKFKPTTEDIKKPKAQENHEAPRSAENAEELREQMTSEAEKQTGQFKQECTDDLSRVEERAKKDGLLIDDKDKKALKDLGTEAEATKKELEVEITPTKNTEKAKIIGVTRDHNFEGSVIVKTEDEEGRITGYALRKNSQEDWEGNEIRYMKDGSIGPVYQLHEKDFSKLGEQGILASYESMPAMKERTIENPKILSKNEASKKYLSEERKKLAQEIREQRNRLSALKIDGENTNKSSESMEDEKKDKIYAKLAEWLSFEANTIMKRLSFFKINGQEASDEQENIEQLIASSEGIKSLKAKLNDHYTRADEIAKNKFESIQKSVEQTMIRNNAFIVHTFKLDERFHHNENSNITKSATLEDDIDILLSLEPSISASSVVPGSKQGLWDNYIGVVLGGGDIQGVLQADNGTMTGGIKMRNGKISSSKEIDEKVSDKSERGYNELVVNNPEVFGFFINIQIDESGNMIGFKKSNLEKDNRNYKENFMKYIDLAIQKGMPPLIMTPDRRLFKFRSISNNGIVSVGDEITPEQVAKEKAGLPNERRTKIGEQILAKYLFKKIDDQKEAKNIIAELSGEERSRVELSQEDYIAFARNYPDRFFEFPKHLLEDKNFMLEAAQFNPVSAYQYAGENLKNDKEFIKHVYSLEKKVYTSSIYSLMPDELKKDVNIALLAIENNDYERIDVTLADSPVVWGKIVDKIVERKNPDKWFSRKDGGEENIKATFFMQDGSHSEDMTEKLTSDASFIQKLNSKYPNYEFKIIGYDLLSVKKSEEKPIKSLEK